MCCLYRERWLTSVCNGRLVMATCVGLVQWRHDRSVPLFIVSLSGRGHNLFFRRASTMAEGQDSAGDNVIALAISPNGKQVVFGTTDGILVLWNTNSRQQILEPIVAHKGIINSLWYASHGGKFISASDDQTIRLWNASTGAVARGTFRGHGDGVLLAGFLADRETETIVSLSKDYTVLVWQVQTGNIEQNFRVTLDSRALAVLSNDGEKLLAVSRKGVTIWDTITATPIRTLPLVTPMALCAGFSHDASRAVLGLADCNLHTWDFNKDDLDSVPLEGHENFPDYVVWSPDSRTIAAVAQDAGLRIWDVEERKCIFGPYITKGPITYSLDGTCIISPNADGFLDICSVPIPNAPSSILGLSATMSIEDHRIKGHGTSRPLENSYKQPGGDKPYALGRSQSKDCSDQQGLATEASADMNYSSRRFTTGSPEIDTVATAKNHNPIVPAQETQDSGFPHASGSRSLTPDPDDAGCFTCCIRKRSQRFRRKR
ncbi:WD40-repeat-containing domain protein [Scleroderma yunnanense]